MMALLLAAAAALPPGPVDFKAQDMRIEPKGHRVFLDGDVHLQRGDLDVTGDHAVADYKQQPAAAPRKKTGPKQASTSLGGEAVDRFTVDGKVHVQRGGRTADGDRGVLDVPGQTLVLTGTQEVPPVLRDGAEMLSGERILLRLDNEDVDVVKPRLVLRRSLPAEDPAEKAKPAAPVKVEAAHMQLFKERQLAKFRDDVVVRRGDTVVRSPRMDARYDKDGQLTNLEMRGGVDLRQGDRRATGESADYDALKKLLVLTGDPKLYDRGDVLAGDRIDMALESKEVRVERAKGRLHPDTHREETASPAPGGARRAEPSRDEETHK
jgi:lipopolysaccharide transport protein LptA